jgi:ABC-type antimicrobial peptide transport system permease subunit
VSSKNFNISEGLTYTLLYGSIGSVVAICFGIFLMHFEIEIFRKADNIEFYLALASIPITLFSTVLVLLFTALDHFKLYSYLIVLNGLMEKKAL